MSDILKKAKDKATDLYDKGKALVAPMDSEAAGVKERDANINQYHTSMSQPDEEEAPAPVNPAVKPMMDQVKPGAKFGDRPGEQRMDVSSMLHPLGQPMENTPAGMVPSYDMGGDVEGDQLAKLHDGEKVLSPEEAEQFRQEQAQAAQPQGEMLMAEAARPTSMMPQQAAHAAKPVAKAPAVVKPAAASTAMHVTPEAPKPAPMAAPEGAAAPVAPNPMDVINKQREVVAQDKVEAAKKGDLVGMGTAILHERELNKSEPMRAAMDAVAGVGQAPAAPTYGGPVKKGAEAPAPGQMLSRSAMTPEDAHKQLEHQRQILQDKIVNAPDEVQRQQARLDLMALNQANPYGSEANHPGVLGKIGHVLAKAGNVAGTIAAPGTMALIPGTDLNKVVNAEDATEKLAAAEGNQLKEAQAKGVETTGETNKARLDLETQKAAEAERKNKETNETNLRKLSYKTDAQGNIVSIPYEELSPTEQAQYDLKQAQANQNDTKALLNKAKADPNSPANKAVLDHIKNEALKVGVAAQNAGLNRAKYMADYFGTDEYGDPLAGTEKDETGKPIGVKVGKENAATGQRLNKADLAQNVQLNVRHAVDLIKANPELFGRVSGRYTHVREMAGSSDPAIRQLSIDLHNVAIASAGIHGMRSHAEVEATEDALLNHFKDSPEATIAGLGDLSNSVQTFIDAAGSGKKVAPTPQTEQEKKAAAAKPAATKLPDGVPKGASQLAKDKQGKVVGYVLNGQYHKLGE